MQTSSSDIEEEQQAGSRGQVMPSPREEYPPYVGKMWWWVVRATWLAYAGMFIYWLCSICISTIPYPTLCQSYAIVATVLPILLINLWVYLPVWTHKERLEDQSIVDGTIVEAQTVEPRLVKPEKLPSDYDKKCNELKEEIERLKVLGPLGWTEYQVLILNQMLVDFLKPDDLIARAKSSLADLEEYAEDVAYGGYDRRHFGRWEERINEAITAIEGAEKEAKKTNQNADSTDTTNCDAVRDKAAEGLRASLKMILEHVAGYQKSWSEGSTILRALMVFCFVAIPTCLAMGLLRGVHPDGADYGKLAIIDWGFVGIAGSLTSFLLVLRKSNVVEIGNTDGRRELWRTLQGTVLGLVAGMLAYSLITGELIGGSAPPSNTDFATGDPKDVALSILWAIGAGFYFERVFERMRTSTEYEE